MSRPLSRSAALFALLLAIPPAASGQAPRPEQDRVLAGIRTGRVMRVGEIERRILPRMGGYDYLGPEYDEGAGIYRLKFMRGGAMVWIDVNASTGAVVGRSGD